MGNGHAYRRPAAPGQAWRGRSSAFVLAPPPAEVSPPRREEPEAPSGETLPRSATGYRHLSAVVSLSVVRFPLSPFTFHSSFFCPLPRSATGSGFHSSLFTLHSSDVLSSGRPASCHSCYSWKGSPSFCFHFSPFTFHSSLFRRPSSGRPGSALQLPLSTFHSSFRSRVPPRAISGGGDQGRALHSWMESRSFDVLPAPRSQLLPLFLRFFVVQPDRTFHHEDSKNSKRSATKRSRVPPRDPCHER